MVWLDDTLTWGALWNLDSGSRCEDGPGVTEVTGLIRELRGESIDSDMELGQSNLGDGIIVDRGVGMRPPNHAVGKGLVVGQQTAGVVRLTDLLWDLKSKTRGQVLGVCKLVVSGNVTGSDACLVGDGEDIVSVKDGICFLGNVICSLIASCTSGEGRICGWDSAGKARESQKSKRREHRDD